MKILFYQMHHFLFANTFLYSIIKLIKIWQKLEMQLLVF